MSFYQYTDGNISTDTSDDSDSDNENKYTEYTEEHLLVANSKDRNYKNGEKTFSYNILFGTNFNQNSVDNGNNSAFFTRNYDNIKSINVETVLLPNLYLNLHELHGLKKNIASFSVRLRRISDLDYIVMNISGYQSNIDGTNKAVSSSSNVLVVDDSKERVNNTGDTNNGQSDNLIVGHGKNLILGTNKSLLYMKNITDINKQFINPISSLNNMNVSFFDPSGKQLTLMNDYMVIDTVRVDTDSEYIILTMTKYFSPEEYSIGDTIIIRNTAVSGGTNTELENFLNRDSGHNIFELGSSSVSSIEMFKEIHIPIDYTVNTNDGSLSNKIYGLTTSATQLSTNSVALNLNNQNSIFFKVTSLYRRANFASELI